MTSEPKPNRPAPSGKRGMTMHQRMEDARVRRAQALAQKPANDDASISKQEADAKPLHRDTKPVQPATPIAKPLVTQPTAKASTRSKPRSRTQSQVRFPDIVMPEETEEKETNDQQRKTLLVAVLALLVVVFGVYYFTPSTFTAPTTQTVLAPSIAEEEPFDTVLPTNETTLSARLGTDALLTPAAPSDLLPRLGTAPQVPQSTNSVLPGLHSNPTAEETPTAPSIAALWQTASLPLMPLVPAREPLFALPGATELTVSLIVPTRAARNQVDEISTILQNTGFEINEPRIVSYKVSDTQVRYFHTSNAKAAEALAKDIGGIARDFTDFVPAPPVGLVEVFIESRQTASPAPARPSESRGLGGDLRQLGNDIRNALRGLTR